MASVSNGKIENKEQTSSYFFTSSQQNLWQNKLERSSLKNIFETSLTFEGEAWSWHQPGQALTL